MFLDVFWTLHDGANVFGANVHGQELQWLFTKYTCCMLRICKKNLDVLVFFFPSNAVRASRSLYVQSQQKDAL